jgi:two-component system sensor histidine kinase HydH
MQPPDIDPTEAPQVPALADTMRTPDLLSSVCHDLRAPLASIVMGAGFLRRALSPDDQAARRVVEAIHRAADGMNQAITTFSDLARLGMRELTLELGSHDLGAIVKSVFDEVVAEPSAQGVAISLELAPDLPTMRCDRERMVQILRQLTGAALRVVPDRGTLLIGARTDGSGSVRVDLVIRRHGEPNARRITSEPPKPTLALARGLIELHGGKLAVAGDADALTMSFALPHEQAAQAT